MRRDRRVEALGRLEVGDADPQVVDAAVGHGAFALADVTFRLVPLDPIDADEMLDDLATGSLLGEFRGEPAVDRRAMAAVLLALSRVAETEPDVRSIDVNPLMIVDGRPVAVDALVEVAGVGE